MTEISFKDRLIKVWREQRPDIKSQRELERILKLSNGSIQKWSESKPNQTTLEKISKGLNVSVDYLLGNTDEKNPHPIKDEDKKTDLAEALSLDQVKSELTSFGGKPVTDHDAKLIKQYLETLFEGRD